MGRLSHRKLGARARRGAALVAAGLAAAGAVSAAPPKPTAPEVKALAQCLALTDDAARLACYDKTARSLVEAEKSGDVVVVDKAQVKEVKRQSFGFNINLGPLFEHGGRTEQVNELVTAVADASQNPDGKWVIRTTDGQVWRQVDDAALFEDPKKGEKIVIRRAALGSYFLKVGSDSSIRAHRDE